MSAKIHAGILADFFDPDEALAAARRVRAEGWTHFDFLTPFPIHGMEEAMGQKRSSAQPFAAPLPFASPSTAWRYRSRVGKSISG